LPALMLLVLSCNTLPVGYDGLGRVPDTRAFVLAPDSVASYGRHAALGSADTLRLGQDDDFRTRCLVKFALPETLTLDSILSIQLILHPLDTLRVDSFEFICRPCSTGWEEASATWVLCKAEEQWLHRGGDYLDTVVARASVLKDSVVFDLQYLALDTALQRFIRDNGLLLFPATDADTGFLKVGSAEATSALQPRTKVIYRTDSTTRYFTTSEDATICDTVPGSTRAYELLVGSGFVFRTWLRFRLDSIPAEATVAEAELRFRPAVQYSRSDSFALSIQRLTEPLSSRGLNPALASAMTTEWYVPPIDSDTVIRFDITSLVQYWTTNRDSAGADTANFGLVIAPDEDWSDFFRLKVPATGADACSLNIRYVLPPQDRFDAH